MKFVERGGTTTRRNFGRVHPCSTLHPFKITLQVIFPPTTRNNEEQRETMRNNQEKLRPCDEGCVHVFKIILLVIFIPPSGETRSNEEKLRALESGI